MPVWPDSRLLTDLGLELPIIQAPMAGSGTPELAAAVSAAGGLGSLGCALLSAEEIEASVRAIRMRTNRPFNLNFFCHTPPVRDADKEARWLDRLAHYYRESGATAPEGLTVAQRPFDAALCDLVVTLRPRVVSFHFGLPEPALVDRVRAAGCRILASATTPAEAEWLEEGGVDAVIAQGIEAGGHNGNFAGGGIATAFGTMSLVPLVADAVSVPVIAAGGIADGRGIAAAFALGASAVQIGTAYLFTPEVTINPVHRAALASAADRLTVHTNVFTGRPARGFVNRIIRDLGPMAADAADFPLLGSGLNPLRDATDASGTEDFTALWAGQAAALGRAMPAGKLTRQLAEDALERMKAATT